MIAADVDGVVGEPGVRYLRTLHDLYRLGDLVAAAGALADGTGTSDIIEATDVPPGEAPVDGGDFDLAPTEPVVGDDAVLESLREIDGVAEVDRSGPGLLTAAVESEEVVAAISSVDGVVGVSVDGLLALADDPRQGEQWMIDNTGSSSQAGGWPGVVGADTNVDAAWEVSTGAGRGRRRRRLGGGAEPSRSGWKVVAQTPTRCVATGSMTTPTDSSTTATGGTSGSPTRARTRTRRWRTRGTGLTSPVSSPRVATVSAWPVWRRTPR